MTNTQKVIKYCSIAFAFFLIFNILSGLVYGISSLGNIFGNNNIKTKLEELNINSDTSILNIELKASNLEIKEGNKLKIETNNPYIETDESNNKLIIKEKKHNWNIKNDNKKLVVYIPKNQILDVIVIDAGAGNTDIDVLNVKKLYFNLGAGNVTIDKLNVVNSSEISTGAGNVSILDGSINNLSLDMGVGKIEIKSEILGDSDIEAGVGKIKLDLIGNDYRMNVEKGIGSITINDQEVKSDTSYGTGINIIDIEGGIGNIEVNYR